MDFKDCIATGNIILAKKIQPDQIKLHHFKIACEFNKLNSLIWLCTLKELEKYQFDYLAYKASINNSLKIIKWLLKNKSIDTKQLFMKLCNELVINEKIIKIIYNFKPINFDYNDTNHIYHSFGILRNLRLIKWIFRLKIIITINIANRYIRYNDNYFQILQLIFKNRPDIIYNAADNIWHDTKYRNLLNINEWILRINPLINILDEDLEFELYS